MALGGFDRPLPGAYQAQNPALSSKKKDFWTDQISTGGGLAGTLGGAAAGAGAGTLILPGVGTVIGGLIGGIAGGATGSGAGEMAENAITGDDLWKNVGQEALLGGVFAAPPLRLARGLGAVGKTVFGQGASEVARGGAKQAFEQAFTAPGTLSKLATTLKGEARGIGVGEKSAGMRIGPEKTSDINSFLEKTVKVKGLTAAKQLESLESFIKSRGDALSGAISKGDRALTNAEKGSISKTLMKDFSAKVISPTTRQQAILSDIATRIGQSKSVSELDGIRKIIDDQINFARNSASPEPAAEQVYKMARALLTDNVASRVGAAKGLKSDLSKAFEAQDLLLNKAGSGGGIARTNGTSIASIPVPERATQAAQTLAGRGLAALGGGAASGMGAGQVLGRFGAGEILKQSMPQQEPSLDEALVNQSSFGQPTGGLSGGAMQAPNGGFNPAVGGATSNPLARTAPSQSPYPKESLLFDIQRDPANADKYIAYYQQVDEIFGQGSGSPLSQSNQSALASADNADNTLNQLEQLFQTAGGGGGRIGGFIQNVAGNAGIDKNASVYNSLSQASVTQIAKALAGAGGGTVSDADARVIIQALPTLQDSPEEAAVKFAALRQRLQNAKGNTLLYGQGGTSQPSLEETLMQRGGF